MSENNIPVSLQRTGSSNSRNRATFVAEPLDIGLGLTLGNALRRVLLSSLQGAAITSIKIENVLHEFSSLAGVREDVVDIVQKVKLIALRMQGDGSKRLQLSATGPIEVTAGMIATSSDIEVMNPDLVICHVDDSTTLNMELTAAVGKGYSAAPANRPAEAPLGLIPVDALYSPIQQVAYKVDACVEHETADRLTITVETNGSISPEDALAYAAIILQDQLHLFVGSNQPVIASASFSPSSNVVSRPMMNASPAAGSASPPVDWSQLNRFMVRKIDDFDLSVRSANGLKGENIIYVGDLVQKTEAEMLRAPNFGRKSLTEIKELLARVGLRLGMITPEWPPENIEALAHAFADDANVDVG